MILKRVCSKNKAMLTKRILIRKDYLKSKKNQIMNQKFLIKLKGKELSQIL